LRFQDIHPFFGALEERVRLRMATRGGAQPQDLAQDMGQTLRNVSALAILVVPSEPLTFPKHYSFSDVSPRRD